MLFAYGLLVRIFKVQEAFLLSNLAYIPCEDVRAVVYTTLTCKLDYGVKRIRSEVAVIFR